MSSNAIFLSCTTQKTTTTTKVHIQWDNTPETSTQNLVFVLFEVFVTLGYRKAGKIQLCSVGQRRTGSTLTESWWLWWMQPLIPCNNTIKFHQEAKFLEVELLPLANCGTLPLKKWDQFSYMNCLRVKIPTVGCNDMKCALTHGEFTRQHIHKYLQSSKFDVSHKDGTNQTRWDSRMTRESGQIPSFCAQGSISK